MRMREVQVRSYVKRRQGSQSIFGVNGKLIAAILRLIFCLTFAWARINVCKAGWGIFIFNEFQPMKFSIYLRPVTSVPHVFYLFRKSGMLMNEN